MSENVQNVQFTDTERMRWESWKNLKQRGYTDSDIARQWKLKSTKQVQRLKNKAKQLGEYKKWVDCFVYEAHEEFWELHKLAKVKAPSAAYAQMGRILERNIMRKTEISTTAEIREIKVKWNVNTGTPNKLHSSSKPVVISRQQSKI